MRGEKLIDVIVNIEGKPTDWPANTEWSTECFVTDKGVYEYAGDRFIKLKTVPTGKTAEGIRDAINKIILDIKKDDETFCVIVFENGDALEFGMDIIYHSTVESSDPTWGLVFTYRKAREIDWGDSFYGELQPIPVT